MGVWLPQPAAPTPLPWGPAPRPAPRGGPAPPRPAPAALLSRPAAVAVALLLVGAVGRVPLQLLRLVGQHHLHSLQGPGDGALLQRAAFLREDEGPGYPRGSRLGHTWLPIKANADQVEQDIAM